MNERAIAKKQEQGDVGMHGPKGNDAGASSSHAAENSDNKWWLSDGEDEDDEDEGDEEEQVDEDELFDPDADEEDERLIHEGREGRVTDAILSCPGCFSTVTVDCQAHQTMSNRYRAMFVMNCVVDLSQIKVPKEGKKRGGGGGGKAKRTRRDEGERLKLKGAEDDDSAAVFHPVSCGVCGTEVGVMDAADEIYHFIDCIASNA